MVAKTRKKKVKTLPRKIKTGLAAAPTDDFRWFCDYFRMEVDKKDLASIIKSYIKKHFKGDEQKLLMSAPEWCYTAEPGVAASIHWQALGHEFPIKWDGAKKVQSYIDRIKSRALDNVKEDDAAPVVTRRSPMELVKEKNSEFISEIEVTIDMFGTKVFNDWDNYSVYNEMIKANLSAIGGKAVIDFYTPLKEELEELVEKKTPDLVEGYSHMSKPQQKKYLKLISSIIDDANRYYASKKATRKPSKPRVKSADKQVAKLNFAPESSEFKITSINPSNIIGARRLYTFNVKYRIITEYVCERSNGFEVRGSTVYGIDAAASRAVKLRKPEESLTAFLTKTPTAINKFWSTLTTKTIDDVNGRINKDTIILRALDK